MDADVPAAVGRELDLLLRERVAGAAVFDGDFAADVAAPVARFTLDGGGRMRSRFLWWAMRACGGAAPETPAALRTAAALELIQTCALVHDDVMDGSPRRRGGPSFHARLAARYPSAVSPATAAAPFASSAAVLAGDLALAWADDIVAGTDFGGDAVRNGVLENWRAMRTEMVAGQYLDLHGQATGSRSAARAIRTACLKTALYSVARPLALGAAVAGADPRTVLDLCAAGRYAGTAFQLRDDIEGVFGDPLLTGKPSGDDIRSGKPTYLVAVARARAGSRRDRAALSVLEGAFGNADLTEDRLLRVREVLTDTGALEAVEKRIGRLLAAGERRLAAAALEPAPARRLRALLAAVAAPTGPTAGPAPAVPPRSAAQAPPAGRPVPEAGATSEASAAQGFPATDDGVTPDEAVSAPSAGPGPCGAPVPARPVPSAAAEGPPVEAPVASAAAGPVHSAADAPETPTAAEPANPVAHPHPAARRVRPGGGPAARRPRGAAADRSSR
ncbi:polyprenyl synthetase family protein [Streptomyces sp. HNM0645]|uniref:polyprenyl synthetase family protein n=1 Tax=Streptomyces sp. HNM0645 TaxID=2782343 RepID=UPI0024B7EA9B|nr:polyprenyl synthetase family protein [Streptomyces sp. HNM0645]MDI9884464.1 polyprenyl synthetase family protein [Streptomyces sp. HNM0645]